MEIKANAESIVQDEPGLRMAIDSAQSTLEEFNEVIALVIEDTQRCLALSAEFTEAQSKLVQNISKIKILYANQSLHIPAQAKAFTVAEEGERTKQGGNRSQLMSSAVSNAIHWLSEWNSRKDKMFMELQENVLDPLIDFHNKLDHITKSAKKRFDKKSDEYENALAKYVSKRSKLLDSASACFNSKKELCAFTSDYIDRLNTFNARKEVFVIDKIIRLGKMLKKYNLLNDKSFGAVSEHEAFIDSMGESKMIFDAEIIEQAESADSKTVFDAALMDLRVALGLEPRLVEISAEHQRQLVHQGKQGYLWKKSRGPMKSWSRKYAWIKNPEGYLMTYGKSGKLSDETVLAELSGSSYRKVEEEERPFVFEIIGSQGTVVLQAENSREATEWAYAIIAASKRKEFIANQATSKSVEMLSKYDDTDESGTESERVDNMRKLNIKSDGDEAILSGYVAVKEFRSRRPSHDEKDYSNTIWRSTRLILQKDGRLVQVAESGKDRIELLDLKRGASLDRTRIQPIDESVFLRKHVFAIRLPDSSRNIFFATNNAMERNQWVYAMKNILDSSQVGVDGKQYRVLRSLSIRIVEGRDFSASSDSYCEIYFANDRVARTNVKSRGQSEPFWREDFNFEDVPPLKSGITIYVMAQHKIQRDSEVGRVVISPSALKPGDIEAWYPIMSGANSSEHNGDLKLKIRYEEEIALPIGEYAGYKELFSKPNQPLIYDISSLSGDLEMIANLMLSVYSAQGLAIPWLQNLIEEEIEATDSMFVLFRGNSILTKALDAYMKVCGLDYLDSTLGDILRDVCENKVYCEVDPSRLEKGEDVKTNWKKFHVLCEEIWKAIENSRPNLPREMRILFHHIQKSVMHRFQQKEDKYSSVRYTSVSGFLFLRFFCPAILNPKLFGLCREFPDPKTARTLTLAAKTLQCLANLANFGVKEPYMVDMNAFIMDHSNHLMEFIDNISVKPNNTVDLKAYPVDVEKQFSSVHRFVRGHIRQFQNLKGVYERRIVELEAHGNLPQSTYASTENFAEKPQVPVRNNSLNALAEKPNSAKHSQSSEVAAAIPQGLKLANSQLLQIAQSQSFNALTASPSNDSVTSSSAQLNAPSDPHALKNMNTRRYWNDKERISNLNQSVGALIQASEITHQSLLAKFNSGSSSSSNK